MVLTSLAIDTLMSVQVTPKILNAIYPYKHPRYLRFKVKCRNQGLGLEILSGMLHDRRMRFSCASFSGYRQYSRRDCDRDHNFRAFPYLFLWLI
jgi:hypothetical protein